ncbi:unnamed protein product (macronuclear) [Paramecium tetraurelia]|uniref:Uncharacterized protein n=1 Tax=Paramecium tetraurelia TaxID=5888 RepID=A0DQ28_PARTE|nr:uncharacterized protein GSPATT00002545001 [Paramecium tetraurelia]CAK85145.1 unnamed protein product [Paramecium tetraurelia]|eukprot:XP_001452542.1 hypothetical protein (macronuclear) [Paramecium tetraurelia strain d4-2]
MNEKGLTFSRKDKQIGQRMEVLFDYLLQYHPKLKSQNFQPNPLFVSFISVAANGEYRKSKIDINYNYQI